MGRRCGSVGFMTAAPWTSTRSPDLPHGDPFRPLFSSPIKVAEEHHQALLLFTDQTNQVFAAGLNRGNFPYFNRLVLYAVDLVGKSMTADPDRSYSTTSGTRLRWERGLEIVGDPLALHCTERNYGRVATSIRSLRPSARQIAPWQGAARTGCARHARRPLPGKALQRGRRSTRAS